MAGKKVPVRILSAIPVGKASYKPNQIVAFESRLAARLVKEGLADDSEEAVAYCVSQGVQGVDHEDAEAEAIAQADADANQ